MSINKSTPFYLVFVKRSEALSYLHANKLVFYSFTYIGQRHETIVPGTKYFITQHKSSYRIPAFSCACIQSPFPQGDGKKAKVTPTKQNQLH